MPLDDFPSSTAETGYENLQLRLRATRTHSSQIVAVLTPEDQVVQAMADASPVKWHLAHTTWFFEELVLKAFDDGYQEFDPRFAFCFNSYYESLGPRHPRGKRGLLTRPSAGEVAAYRAHVDAALMRLFERGAPSAAQALIEIGINHEQQHQELMLTDILALFAANPLHPAYRETPPKAASAAPELSWLAFSGGIYQAGHDGQGFAYDNEGPRHDVLLRDFRLANRPVTNGEWLQFMADGGYQTAAHWLSDGWARVQRLGWRAPEYWEKQDGGWGQMTLHGFLPVDANRPVCHLSYYEADAFARWAGARLPSEFEWETACNVAGFPSRSFDFDALLPQIEGEPGPQALLPGGVWEWTQSAYLPYPGYKPVAGPLGEYNGKFMCNQFVLRGGSCVTPNGHIRTSYRNFFYPHNRWQFKGLRLAADA